jgi:hypothetical protein
MKLITKIIFLHEGHFSQAYYEMFGIETLEQNGFIVEVWNFMPFLKHADFQKETPPDPITWDGYQVFQSRRKAKKAVSEITPCCLVICGLHYNLETYAFYRILTKNNIIYCSNLAMALPTGTIPVRRSVAMKINKINIRRLLNKAFLSIPFRYAGVKPVDIVFAMGEKFFRHAYPLNDKSEILNVHFYDYDKYLIEKATPHKIDPKNGVFLDEYLPFHTDNIDAGLPSVQAEEYYPLLCTFFDFLEKKYGVHITIAAHPRSKYDEMLDLFGGRRVIRGKTVELVKNAGFVLMHQSMSINYAVLFRKPIVFITTDQVNQYLVEDPAIEWLAAFFGKKAHNLNRGIEVDLKTELPVREDSYRQYQNDYIKKTGSEEKMLWQIVADRIKKIQ